MIITSGNQNKTSYELLVNVRHGKNDTFILNYNLSTNYSYYVTFRLFESEQVKFGLFLPTIHYQPKPIEIRNQHQSSSETFYLLIVCFYFLLPSNDIDVQCIDKRLSKHSTVKPHLDYQPSYKPLFLPLMYALSVIMLLPVIIQHRHRKHAESRAREKELKRLSSNMSQNTSETLPASARKGLTNVEESPMEIELVSLASTRTILDEIDENDKVMFTIQNVQNSIDRIDYVDQSMGNSDDNDIDSDITADDCVGHLLNNTPWSSSVNYESTALWPVRKISGRTFQDQKLPIIIVSDSKNQETTIFKSNTMGSSHSFSVNTGFIGS